MCSLDIRFNRKFSKEVVDRLVLAFSYGCSDQEAAAAAQVKPGDLNQWLLDTPDFAERRSQLRDSLVIDSRVSLRDGIRGDPERGIEPDGYLAFRVLERLRRREFGPAAPEGGGTEAGEGGYSDVPARLIGPQFADFFRDVSAGRHRHYWEYGGCGAGRSSAISLAVTHLLMTRPGVNALVCRLVANTIRDSVFSRMQWAIEAPGPSDLFAVSRGRLEIELSRTGQKIYFRGLDEPAMIKSIKPRDGYIGVFWLEEADQVRGPADLPNVQQSIMRGGEDCWFFRSWNTPRDRNHWINAELRQSGGRPDVRVSRTDYRGTPEEWLGRPFIEEAEALRVRDAESHRHERLGEAVGYGGEIFRYLSLESLSDETVARFGNVRYGIDWGFTTDPFAFVKEHYDARARAPFIFRVLAACRLTGDMLEVQLERVQKATPAPIFAGCEEPKSLENMRLRGFNILGARKFRHSVEHGVRFLQSHDLIVIDPARCPAAAREFSGYSNVRGHGGEFLPVIQRKDDLTADATRYAMNIEIAAWAPARSGFVTVLS